MDATTARSLLSAARDAVLRARDGLVTDGLAHADGDEVPDIIDPQERSELLTEEQLDRSVMAGFDAQLAELDAAERRLSDGTCGRCETCHQPIADERLEAVVWTRFCVAHQGAGGG